MAIAIVRRRLKTTTIVRRRLVGWFGRRLLLVTFRL
jgi:hypothetical protein